MAKKKFIRKIFAGVLAAAMILGNFAGMGAPVAEAAVPADVLKFRLVNEAEPDNIPSEITLNVQLSTGSRPFIIGTKGASYTGGSYKDGLISWDAAEGSMLLEEIYATDEESCSFVLNSEDYELIDIVTVQIDDGEFVDVKIGDKSVEPNESGEIPIKIKKLVDKKHLNVTAVDELDGSPVNGVKFCLSKDDNTFSFEDSTGNDGIVSYAINNLKKVDSDADANTPDTYAGNYTLTLDSAESIYECKSPITITVTEENGSLIISEVNGEEYTGMVTVSLHNKNADDVSSIIEEVKTTEQQPISRDKETITINVTGTNLPASLFYKVKGKYNGFLLDTKDPVAELTAQGDGTTEKTIEVPLPKASDYPTATAWEIGIGVTAEDCEKFESSYTFKSSGDISIAPDTVTSETENRLTELINEMKTLTASDYTADTWEAYSNAVSAGNTTLQDYKRTNTQCLNAIKKIEDAKSALAAADKSPATEASKAALNTALQEADKLNAANYTTESWKAYNDAIEAAQVLTEKADATEAEYQAAIKAIADAKKALVSVSNDDNTGAVTAATKSALNTAIQEAAKLNAANYTAASWKVYNDAIQAAKTLVAKDNATETECKAALDKITAAKKALVLQKKNTVKVSKITISASPSSAKLAVGKTIQLTAKVAPANASNKAVTWTSSNKKYATVTAKGKVTVKKAGAGKSVKITATAKDGSGKKAVYQIKIMKDAVKNISLSAKKNVKAGKVVTVKATVKTTGKSANKKLTWITSNKKYATVNSKGKVSTKKAGKGKTVTITAKATDGSNKKGTVKIKIK